MKFDFHSEKKGYPLGTISTNGALFSKGHSFSLNNHVCEKKKYEIVPLGHWGIKIVPLRVPYYRQSNSAPRGTVSVPFFRVPYIPHAIYAPLKQGKFIESTDMPSLIICCDHQLCRAVIKSKCRSQISIVGLY